MTLAINTSPENAISNLFDLIEEVRDEMDDDQFPQSKIYRAIGRAEGRFNRELRAPQMEAELLMQVTNEITDLPIDFLQMRNVYQEGTPDTPLRNVSAGQLRRAYQGVTGRPKAYAIENRRLIIGPVGPVQLQITYFQKIPALTESNQTNWLMGEHPDVYLHQVLANLFNKIGDSERAVLNLQIADGIIGEINATSVSARWGAGPVYPSRRTTVCGVDF